MNGLFDKMSILKEESGRGENLLKYKKRKDEAERRT